MTKKLLGFGLGAALMLSPLAALANTDITNLTLDGFANATVDVGDSVSAKVTYDVTSNDDVESLSWELVGSGLPKTCVDVPDQINTGTFHPEFDIDTTGATAGTWDVKIQLYGTNDEGVNQLCEGTADDTMTFTNRIAISESNDNNTGTGTGTGNTGTGNGKQSQLDKLIALLTALVAGKPSTPTSTSAVCTAYSQANSGTLMNARNSANIRLQGFLLSQGADIPALAAGASFGFFGPQTIAAQSLFVSSNHCQ